MNQFVKAPGGHTPERKAAILEYFRTLGSIDPEAVYDKQMVNSDRYENDLYAVTVRDHKDKENDFIHLSIVRNDKQPIHEWRDLQEIKNMIIGEEYEAVELYPATERLVDTSNQYHLWVAKDKTFRFPFGFTNRAVDYNPPEKTGLVQKPKEE